MSTRNLRNAHIEVDERALAPDVPQQLYGATICRYPWEAFDVGSLYEVRAVLLLSTR